MVGHLLLIAVLLVGALMTLAGVLAPIHPAADFANHFRPYTFAGTVALLVCALALRVPWAAGWSAVLVGLNVALLALPLLWAAESAQRRAAGQALAAGENRDLKIVTFNMRFEEAGRVARFLVEEDADIVVLQEAGARDASALGALLRDRYPHRHSCGVAHRCAAAIFAKRAWVASGLEPWTKDGPELVWVEFNDRQIGRLRVVGVHLALPFRPGQQIRHVDRLIALRDQLTAPAIFAGDFNMTPWSYHLQRLLSSAGMRQHATLLRSWPTDGQFRLPIPTFPIDHVITTPDIRTVSIRTGPNLGSDHLPVIAVLRLPPR